MNSIDSIVGGVTHNLTAEWLLEDIMYHSIDLDFEVHRLDCKQCQNDACGEINAMGSLLLIGFVECKSATDAWYGHEGKYGSIYYKPDNEAEYSAIVGEIYSQIVRSKYYSLNNYCSPCYPNQGDLDTPGTIKTYALPRDLYGEVGPVAAIHKI